MDKNCDTNNDQESDTGVSKAEFRRTKSYSCSCLSISLGSKRGRNLNEPTQISKKRSRVKTVPYWLPHYRIKYKNLPCGCREVDNGSNREIDIHESETTTDVTNKQVQDLNISTISYFITSDTDMSMLNTASFISKNQVLAQKGHGNEGVRNRDVQDNDEFKLVIHNPSDLSDLLENMNPSCNTNIMEEEPANRFLICDKDQPESPYDNEKNDESNVPSLNDVFTCTSLLDILTEFSEHFSAVKEDTTACGPPTCPVASKDKPKPRACRRLYAMNQESVSTCKHKTDHKSGNLKIFNTNDISIKLRNIFSPRLEELKYEPAATRMYCTRQFSCTTMTCYSIILEPGAFKDTTTADYYLSFVVIEGLVSVTINGIQAICAKPQIFRVPQGIEYSVRNDFNVDAKLTLLIPMNNE